VCGDPSAQRTSDEQREFWSELVVRNPTNSIRPEKPPSGLPGHARVRASAWRTVDAYARP
jgi:hypothetical protein